MRKLLVMLATSVPPLLLTGCHSLTSNALYDCPHPWSEVKQAEQYVTSIVDLPQHALTALPSADNPDGGPCPRPLIPGHLTAACVTFDDGVIWRDDSLLTLNRLSVYRHEVCHLYEARVLGLSDHQHVGWLDNLR